LAGKSTGFSAKNEKYNAIKHFPEPKNPFMALIGWHWHISIIKINLF
jgi:hypothetical protein